MNEFNFSVPQNIIVGRGSMAKLPEVAKKMGGKHAFIISGPHLKKMGLVEKAAESLRAEGILVDDFTDIEGNPYRMVLSLFLLQGLYYRNVCTFAF